MRSDVRWGRASSHSAVDKLPVYLLNIGDISLEFFDKLALLTEHFECRMISLVDLKDLLLESLNLVVCCPLLFHLAHKRNNLFSGFVSLIGESCKLILQCCLLALQTPYCCAHPLDQLNRRTSTGRGDRYHVIYCPVWWRRSARALERIILIRNMDWRCGWDCRT